MLNREIYIRRLSQCLQAQGELDFLEKLSVEELAVLWAKVARQTLQQARLGMRSA